MKHLILTLTLFLFASITPINAQKDEIETEPNFTLKYSPLSILSLQTPMIQFAGENFIKSNIGLQYELGVLSSDILKPRNSGSRSLFGGRLKTEIRSYKYTHYYRVKVRQFWGFGIRGQQVFVNQTHQFCVPTTNCGSIRTIPMRESTAEISLYASFGSQYFFTKHFFVEANLFGGITRQNDYYTLPESLQHTAYHTPRWTTHILFNTLIYIGYAF